MKYIFFGTPKFAEIILQGLIENDLPPAAIVCNPDKPAGKKKTITPPLTKVLAEKHNLKILQPDKVKDIESELKDINPDFALVAAYGKIIPDSILSLPKSGTIGVHPSLLPKYRGATPIQSAILSSEKTTGISLYLMDKEVDHGPILLQEEINIDDKDTYLTLEKKLAKLGIDLLNKAISTLDKITPKEQNHSLATFTKKFETKDGEVDMEKDDPQKIYQKIKALAHEPGVYTLNFPNKERKRVKLLEAEFTNKALRITKIQVAGKNPINI